MLLLITSKEDGHRQVVDTDKYLGNVELERLSRNLEHSKQTVLTALEAGATLQTLFRYFEKYEKPAHADCVERSCFGLFWFVKEDDAETYAAFVRHKGLTYNGGFFHGMKCGREKQFDKETENGKLYAVSH